MSLCTKVFFVNESGWNWVWNSRSGYLSVKEMAISLEKETLNYDLQMILEWLMCMQHDTYNYTSYSHLSNKLSELINMPCYIFSKKNKYGYDWYVPWSNG